MRKLLIVLCGVLILGLLNYTIYSREQLISNGQTVLLELAPVDPRSLMQGDYMALRFAVAREMRQEADMSTNKNGFVTLQKDEQGIGRFVGIDKREKISNGQMIMQYRQRNKTIKFATDAFFFQEGKASLYNSAKYGEFKVATNGKSILVGMRDAKLQPLGEVTKALE